MSEGIPTTSGGTDTRPLGRFAVQPPNILKISVNNGVVDDLAARALAETGRHFAGSGKVTGSVGFESTTAAALAYIREHGLSSQIGRLTTMINRSGLDDTSRRVLAVEGVYPHLLLRALQDDNVKSDDLEGLRFSVMLHLSDESESPMGVLVRFLVKNVLQEGKIELDHRLQERVAAELQRAGASLLKGKSKPAVLAVLARFKDDGELPDFVDQFLTTRSEVDPTVAPESLRAAMVRHLRTLGLKDFSDEQFQSGKLDEYFAVAYDNALRSTTGESDPLSIKFGPGGAAATTADWDFTVDDFSTIEQQGIVRENIAAAGALYYVYELGERLGIYRLADALVLRWASGALDVAEGAAATQLYRYWKLRDDRSPEEERGLIYKRVLDVGDANVLSRMIVNEEFPALWHRLMEEVARYIEKFEKSVELDSAGSKVSRSSIFEAVRNLQFNLTDHMTGMAHMQVREMYAHLRDAMALLGHEEIVDFFGGGSRKNLWTVIGKLAAEEFHASPNIAAIRTSAVEGNHVFRFVSSFDGFASVREEDFRSFLESAEAWILAQGSMGPEMATPDEEAGDEEDAAYPSEEETDDWDA